MGFKETAETWVRIDLICDGFDSDGTCLLGDGKGSAKISDVAPTEEGARKAILNAAVKECWRFDPKLQRWLCPKCACARDASAQTDGVELTDGPPSVPQRSHFLGGSLGTLARAEAI
jgi:hypothetical protein